MKKFFLIFAGRTLEAQATFWASVMVLSWGWFCEALSSIHWENGVLTLDLGIFLAIAMVLLGTWKYSRISALLPDDQESE